MSQIVSIRLIIAKSTKNSADIECIRTVTGCISKEYMGDSIPVTLSQETCTTSLKTTHSCDNVTGDLRFLCCMFTVSCTHYVTCSLHHMLAASHARHLIHSLHHTVHSLNHALVASYRTFTQSCTPRIALFPNRTLTASYACRVVLYAHLVASYGRRIVRSSHRTVAASYGRRVVHRTLITSYARRDGFVSVKVTGTCSEIAYIIFIL